MAAALPALSERRAARLLSEAVAKIEPEARLRRLLAARPEHHPRYAAEQERAIALARLRRADTKCLELGSSSLLSPSKVSQSDQADELEQRLKLIEGKVTDVRILQLEGKVDSLTSPRLPAVAVGHVVEAGPKPRGGGHAMPLLAKRGAAPAPPRPPVAPPPPLAASPRRRPDADTRSGVDAAAAVRQPAPPRRGTARAPPQESPRARTSGGAPTAQRAPRPPRRDEASGGGGSGSGGCGGGGAGGGGEGGGGGSGGGGEGLQLQDGWRQEVGADGAVRFVHDGTAEAWGCREVPSPLHL